MRRQLHKYLRGESITQYLEYLETTEYCCHQEDDDMSEFHPEGWPQTFEPERYFNAADRNRRYAEFREKAKARETTVNG